MGVELSQSCLILREAVSMELIATHHKCVFLIPKPNATERNIEQHLYNRSESPGVCRKIPPLFAPGLGKCVMALLALSYAWRTMPPQSGRE